MRLALDRAHFLVELRRALVERHADVERHVARLDAVDRFHHRRHRVDVRQYTYREWFVDELGMDPFTASIDELRAPLAGVRIDTDGLVRDDWLDLLVTHRLQPEFPRDRMNPFGGSLALGHPFGATGARILSQAVKELAARPKGERAVVSICADGGQGTMMLLESA